MSWEGFDKVMLVAPCPLLLQASPAAVQGLGTASEDPKRLAMATGQPLPGAPASPLTMPRG